MELLGIKLMYAEGKNIASGCEYGRVVKSNSEKNRLNQLISLLALGDYISACKSKKRLVACAAIPAWDSCGVLFNLQEIVV